MKNKTFFDSVKCAFNGLFHAFKTEKNYRRYLIIVSLFLIADIIVQVHYLAYIFEIISFFGACSTESLNTAIERLVDMEHKEIREEIRIIKDVAASAVLIWGFLFFGSGLFFLIMGVISWF